MTSTLLQVFLLFFFFGRIPLILLLVDFNSWVISIFFLTLFEWSFCYCLLLAGSTQYQLTQTHQIATQQQLQQQGQTVSQALSNYVYDPSSGFYYDPSTGLYYDAKTQVIILIIIAIVIIIMRRRKYKAIIGNTVNNSFTECMKRKVKRLWNIMIWREKLKD